jgi:hypothetical protein
MPVTINGSAGVTTNSGAIYNGIQSGTAVTASGTSVDFTGIPSWVKRITVMLSGVSTNGTSNLLIQLGDSGGVETSGYAGCAWTSNTGNLNYTTGILLTVVQSSAANITNGQAILSFVGANTWVASSTLGRSEQITVHSSAGSKELSATLDRIRITTVNGTDTFDAGSINILYE